jgi:biopolymer transport protein ExbD
MASHRWIFLLPLSFIFYVLLVCYQWMVPGYSFVTEHGMEVRMDIAKQNEEPPLPPITISDDGTVAFEELRFGWKDRELDALRLRLQSIAPKVGPAHILVIHPSPEVRHERLVEVLSAVRRAGIYQYCLR